MSDRLRVIIIGAGAVGCLYGAKLSQVGAEVSVVARSDYDVVKDHGYQIQCIWGDFIFKPTHVLKDIHDYPETADIILVATKVLPDINIPKIIHPVVSENTTILLIQNGMFIEAPIKKACPNNLLALIHI